MASTFVLRREAICKGCSRYLKVGANAYRGMKGQGVRCALCGPFPLPAATKVTVLPPGRAEGARGHVDGLTPIRSKADVRGLAIAKQQGQLASQGPSSSRRKRRSRRPKPP